MEAEWFAKRASLRCLLHTHPDWTICDLAKVLQMSVGWVKKWKHRLHNTSPHDLGILHARSRARLTPFPTLDEQVRTRILQIREHPPEDLQRVPGARTIQYFLHRQTDLISQGLWLPRSPRTIWKLLRKEGMILPPAQRRRRPLPPRQPLEEVQIDFKDVTTVAPDPDGKRQHVVETCNMVDAGTSRLLFAQVRDDFRAETAFDAVVAFLRQYGLPPILTFDRDPRWVGGQANRDFPSALRRFLLCLGIEPNICPPHQPQKNAYVERYHRSYKYECLLVQRPATLVDAIEVTARYRHHYNQQRPHQGRTCRNQPPALAFPHLPVLPPLPALVDPDRWVHAVHGLGYVRRVGPDGCITVDDRSYYVGVAVSGKTVCVQVDAPSGSLQIMDGVSLLKIVPIKGLQGGPMPLEPFIAWMREQALVEARRSRLKGAGGTWRQRSLWGEHWT